MITELHVAVWETHVKSSVCFDIVVLPVFTCYVHTFYETKTNNYLKHIFHMQTEGLRIYNIYV